MSTTKKDLLQFCRYYKGEETPPEHAPNWWGYEEKWVELSANPKEDTFAFNLIGEYIDNYIRAGLASYCAADGVPITLKALIFDRCKHFGGDANSFKHTYENDYKKGE